VPFDPQGLEVTGREQKLIDGVMSASNGTAQFTISTNDTLAYVAGGLTPDDYELVWVDREGGMKTIADVGPMFSGPRLSPDGTQLALSIEDGANLDIWLLDLMRLPALTRVTSHPGEDFSPVWDPIGGRLAFASEIGEDTGELGPGLAWIEGSSEDPQQLLQTPEMGDWDFPTSWSPDGQWLAFLAIRGGASGDIYLLPVDGEREPVAFLTTPATELAGMFSPNGQWIAYVSDESGRYEVYMRPFPGPGSRIQVSTNGGIEPNWSRDGRELFYREGNRMMSVSLREGSAIDLSAPEALFEGRFEYNLAGARTSNYDVSLDGSRFVMVRRKNPVTPTVIQVVFNWSEQLNSQVPNE
jgi:Tol biopolymer transport system component